MDRVPLIDQMVVIDSDSETAPPISQPSWACPCIGTRRS